MSASVNRIAQFVALVSLALIAAPYAAAQTDPKAPTPETSAKPPIPDDALPAKPAPPALPPRFRVTQRAPEPAANWIVQREPPSKIVYVCKPLSCPDKVRVAVDIRRSPVGNPDPVALEKFAKIEYPKQLQALSAAASVLADQQKTLTTLDAKVTTVFDRPAIYNETQIVAGQATTFGCTFIVFAGPVMISIASTSPDEPLAKKMLDEMVKQIKIEPLPPGKGAPGANEPI